MSAQEITPARHEVEPTGRRMRVLLVGKSYPDRGGIPTFLEMLRGGALAERHDVRLLNVAHDGVRQGGKFTTGNIGRTVRDALDVRKHGRRADVVHIHSALAPAVTVVRAGLLALAGRSRGCTVVVHAHGGNIQTWLTTPLRRAIMRLAMAPAHSVVAVWTAGENALREVLPAGKVTLIDNGVPLDRVPEPGPPNDPPRILYVGLLTPRKGVLDLVEASRILRERGADHELHLLGGAPDEGPEAEAAVRDNLPPRCSAPATPPTCPPSTPRPTSSACRPGGRPCRCRSSRPWRAGCPSSAPTSATSAAPSTTASPAASCPCRTPRSSPTPSNPSCVTSPSAARWVPRGAAASRNTSPPTSRHATSTGSTRTSTTGSGDVPGESVRPSQRRTGTPLPCSG